MFPSVLRKVLIAGSLAGFLSGCFSSQCEDMGFTPGTPEHARCDYQLRQQMAQIVMQGGQNISESFRPTTYTLNCLGCR